jgi:hypothetical protein
LKGNIYALLNPGEQKGGAKNAEPPWKPNIPEAMVNTGFSFKIGV